MAVRAFLVALACLCLPTAAGAAGGADIVVAARGQVGVTVVYDPAYRSLGYPGGDVPADRGVCTDVVVRALRTARAMDLQRRVHEDMKAHWDAYPHHRRWGLSKPDPNIDHRRVPNLMTYFKRAGYETRLTRTAADYLPGDIVAWDLGRGILHIGIVSDVKSVTGTPLVVHNIGSGAREEDILFRFTIIGHYRLPPPPVAAARASVASR
ncbi:MAG TPA: DUF1287 domain-containing protein [Steroidobacteraceae bacterium]